MSRSLPVRRAAAGRSPAPARSTDLLSTGRPGPAPVCPYELGEPGRAWWNWAWSTPQACAWSIGDLYVTARRAQLEDVVAAIDGADEVIAELAASSSERAQRLAMVLRRLKVMSRGRLPVLSEMRQIDDRLGLTPTGLAHLRWRIVNPRPTSRPAPPRRGLTK